MKAESYSENIEREIPQEILPTYMDIQQELMSRAVSPDEGEDGLINWIDQHGKGFREALLAYFDQHSDLQARWENAAERETVLGDVQALMSESRDDLAQAA